MMLIYKLSVECNLTSIVKPYNINSERAVSSRCMLRRVVFIGKLQYTPRSRGYLRSLNDVNKELAVADYSYHKYDNEKNNENNDQEYYAAT